MKIINDFDGEEEYEYLSNFYPSKFTLIDIEFSNVEQYFQYMKAMFFNDIETANIDIKALDEKELLGEVLK